MNTREQLHSIIDHMDEDELLAASMHLLSVLNRRLRPTADEAESARLQERGKQFGATAEQHWCEAVQRGTGSGRSIVSGFGGGGSFGFDHRGRANGKVSYGYWAEEASITETLLMFAGQEFEIVERFALSDDETKIIYNHRVSSGGRVVTREEDFPVNKPAQRRQT